MQFGFLIVIFTHLDEKLDRKFIHQAALLWVIKPAQAIMGH